MPSLICAYFQLPVVEASEAFYLLQSFMFQVLDDKFTSK